MASPTHIVATDAESTTGKTDSATFRQALIPTGILGTMHHATTSSTPSTCKASRKRPSSTADLPNDEDTSPACVPRP